MKIKQQYDFKDCGLVVLQSFYKYFNNKWISINNFKLDAIYSKSGINLENLEIIAKKWGMKALSLEGDYETLINYKIKQPIVVIIKENFISHYVIIESKKSNYFVVLDPIFGKRKIDFDTMKTIYQNVVVLIEKEKFIEPKINNNFWKFLTFMKVKDILIVFLITVFKIILIILSSFYFKIMIIQNNLNSNINLLLNIFIVFLTIFITKSINNLIKKWFWKNTEKRIEEKLKQKIIDNFTNSKLSEINKINSEDRFKRLQSIKSLSNFTSQLIYSIFFEILIFIISFLVLFFIDKTLTLISFTIFIIIFFISFINFKFLKNNHNQQMNLEIKNLKNDIDLINCIDKLKYENFNKYFLNKKNMLENQLKDFEKTFFIKNNFFNTIMEVFLNLTPVFIVFVSISNIFNSNISLSTIIVFITFFNFAINPLTKFSQLIIFYPGFINDLDNFSYFDYVKKEKNKNKSVWAEKINKIHLKDFYISYDNSYKIIDIKSLEITENTIIQGNNGSGKSTLLKSINLSIEHKGTYIVNDKNIKKFNLQNIREKMILLESNEYFEHDILINLITQNNLEYKKVLLENIMKYKLDVWLEKYKINLLELADNNFEKYSLGQKQIVNSLKLLSHQYDVILLDEAFDNIDKIIFDKLIESIKNFQNNAIFIEISHNDKYVYKNKVIDLEK